MFKITVSGQVVDASGLPLIGVAVIEVGTTNGTSTDFDGNYTIEVAEGSQLQFSYIGFETVTVTVGSSPTIDVTLEEKIRSAGRGGGGLALGNVVEEILPGLLRP